MRCLPLNVYQMLMARLLTGTQIWFCIGIYADICTSTMCTVD